MKTRNGVCGYKAGNPVCCSHYHLRNGTCEECTDGYFGRYCTPCIYPSYGYLCRFTCNCLQSLCHNEHGCPESTMQSTKATTEMQQTMESTIATTETRQTMTEPSSTMSESTTRTWTSRSYDSTYMVRTSMKATVSVCVPPDQISQTSTIIIVGSFICFFLISILGMQIHTKFQKQKSVSKRKTEGNPINRYKSEIIYDQVEEDYVSMVTNKYDIIANQMDSHYINQKFVDTDHDASFVPICSSSILYLDVVRDDYPENHALVQKNFESLSQPNLSLFDDSKQNEYEPVQGSISLPTEIKTEIYLPNPIDSGHQEYVEPIDEKSNNNENTLDLSFGMLQNSTYLDVVFK